jgi:pyruvate/2-oxoglutarate dehydrogenase complex dihydrolipoamide dehydrogenase (E3) component
VVSTDREFDVVVIEGGPGGYAAARHGAAVRLLVAVVADVMTISKGAP